MKSSPPFPNNSASSLHWLVTCSAYLLMLLILLSQTQLKDLLSLFVSRERWIPRSHLMYYDTVSTPIPPIFQMVQKPLISPESSSWDAMFDPINGALQPTVIASCYPQYNAFIFALNHFHSRQPYWSDQKQTMIRIIHPSSSKPFWICHFRAHQLCKNTDMIDAVLSLIWHIHIPLFQITGSKFWKN